MDLHPPHEVRRIARRLEEARFETWAVGGAVRDALRGHPPGDWDLTTAARPGDVQRLFRRTIPVGVEHGTVGVLGRDGHLYEVTTFRRDVETFGRKARVAFADRLDDDLERRDFTINAVAWHPLTGEVRDPHGGVEDLAAGVLRTVGDPAARFSEDRLRVLRALRFAGRFDLRIDDATWAELKASSDKLHGLSPERVREELYKVLAGQREPSRSLRLYEQSGVLAALYPELQAMVGSGEGDRWTFTLAVVDALPRSRVVLRLAALLHGIGGSAGGADAAAIAWQLMRRLRASNAHADRVAHLVAQHADVPAADAPAAELRRWLQRVGLDYYRDVLRLRLAMAEARGWGRADLLDLIRRVRRVLRARPPLTIGDLAIGGAELAAAGIRPGPRYGEILRELLEKVTEDPSLNTREQLIALLDDLD